MTTIEKIIEEFEKKFSILYGMIYVLPLKHFEKDPRDKKINIYDDFNLFLRSSLTQIRKETIREIIGMLEKEMDIVETTDRHNSLIRLMIQKLTNLLDEKESKS